MQTSLSSVRRGWPGTSDKKNQRYGKHEQSDRTSDQSQQLGEKRDIRHSHRLWPLSDEVVQIMQGLPERTENRSNCQQSADDHRDQACPIASPRDRVHASNETQDQRPLARGACGCKFSVEVIKN